MSHAKHASKRKRRSKALPVLGATGLSLSLMGGASATGGPAADMPTARNTALNHEIILSDEEISDVSLATFYVFDKENGPELGQPLRLAAGCGHGGGGGGCGGCGHGGGGGGCGGCGHGCGGMGHGCGGMGHGIGGMGHGIGGMGHGGFGRGRGFGRGCGFGCGGGFYGGGFYGGGFYGGYGGCSGFTAVPAPIVPGGGAVANCEARFRSYNPATGMYLGYDGQHHPCP